MTEKVKNMYRYLATLVLAVFSMSAFIELHATDLVGYQPSDYILINCEFETAYGQSAVVQVDRSAADIDGVQVGDNCAVALAKVNRIDATCSVSACSSPGPGCWNASCDLKANVPDNQRTAGTQ